MSGPRSSAHLTRCAATRLAKSASYGVIAQIITLSAPLIMMPPMLNHLGEARFGLWASCVSATSILVFLDFGTGNALTTRLSQVFSEGNLIGARKLIAGALKIYLVIFSLGSVMAIVILSVIDRYLGNVNFVYIALPVFLSFLASLPVGVIYRIFHAKQQMLFYHMLSSVSVLVAALVSFMAIKLGAPCWQVVSLLSGLPVLIASMVLLLELASHYEPRDLLGDAVAAETKDLFALGSKFFVLSILTNFGMNSDILLISFTLGVEAAARV